MTYTWAHQLPGEAERLQLMSELLDPWTTFRLSRLSLAKDARCLEVGAGSGSVSTWLSRELGPAAQVTATDLDLTTMPKQVPAGMKVWQMDVVNDEIEASAYDLVVTRALLHHLPQRQMVVEKLWRAVKPGGWLMIEEPDFYPTWTATPARLREFWQAFIEWSASRDIDYYVGRKIPIWLQRLRAEDLTVDGRTIFPEVAIRSSAGGRRASRRSRT